MECLSSVVPAPCKKFAFAVLTMLSLKWCDDTADTRAHGQSRSRRHLERLDAAVPTLRASSPDRRHFWQAFASMAAAIESKAATSEDAQFVGRRAEEILSWHGLENMAEHV
ncbi:hypothetical protein KIP31_09325 [Xanthomonas campestris pv. campestris]|jgi:hypothetical protein|nr:hypothetical protein [Xanthomonas campestris]MBD8249301.1 hypothetical protein [Xanthomonas campestris]MCC5045595.1 hypothetical protein [Xanthomonas campestris]MCC5078649.1 hypothetical protein [Xanthomonas campestris pv. campestris]MCD0248271.1 hypothetical protein [Xanthomonas campestris pv. campestris]MCD0252410.1 hypothetical protein [Xanthomonas campestris pv. campestris]